MSLSPSAVALREAIKDPSVRARVDKVIHRVALSRLIHGHRLPDATTAGLLHEATGGAVAANGWLVESDPRVMRAREKGAA